MKVGIAVAANVLSDQVFEEMRGEIESLVLTPGTPIREIDLAERFKVSRTPVRDALRRLEALGLVETVNRRGNVVASISYREALEAYEIREQIEPFAARQAATHLVDVRAIEQLIARIDSASARPLSKEEILERELLDRDFHEFVASASGNQLVAKLVAEMRSKMRRMFVGTGRAGGFEMGKGEHLAVLHAISDRNGEEAAKAMLQHLRQSRQRLLEFRPDTVYGQEPRSQ